MDKCQYTKRGNQHQLGILFYGKPGTGKTSLLKAISNEYKIDIYLVNLEQINTDAEFIKIM